MVDPGDMRKGRGVGEYFELKMRLRQVCEMFSLVEWLDE